MSTLVLHDDVDDDGDGDGDEANNAVDEDAVRNPRKLQRCVTNIRIYSFDKRGEVTHCTGDDDLSFQ